MNRTLLFICFLFCAGLAISQPVNDDCSGLIELGNAPICPNPNVYTNFEATESDIGNDNFPPCFNGTPERDVWFSFVATPAIEDYKITVTATGGSPIANPQIAIYRGDCGFDELVFLDCATSPNGADEVGINISGLTAGITYFLRINDYSVTAAPNSGSFLLCVEENLVVEYTIDELFTTNCSGLLYDTGGPNGDYGNNENHTFTICPSDPHECILFSLTEYNIQNDTEAITFYDGSNTSGPVIGSITGGGNENNHGGVCYSVAASSGCITVQFQSNGNTTFEGFEGFWECTSEDCPTPDPLNVSPGSSIAELEAALSTATMEVTVTDINCQNNAYGIFSATDDTNLGMNEGVLLTTGIAAEAANPASFFADNNLNLGGDPDFNALRANYGFPGQQGNTDDACILELEVFVKAPTIGFDFVFGSEEYKNNFSLFSNDYIGMLISGPDIPGDPVLNNQENIAFIPGTNSLIENHSVNSGINWEYYRDNRNSETIVYQGLTSGFKGSSKTLTASRTVTPCETYALRIGIIDTDAGDDSGLFLNSSRDGLPELSVDFNTGINYLVEGCTDTESVLNINLSSALDEDITFDATVSGTATMGDDYTLAFPGQITIPAGQTTLTFPITAIEDAIMEGTETVEITLSTDFGCGVITLSSVLIEIKDELEIQVLPSADTAFVCDGINSIDLAVDGATSYSWTPGGIFDNETSATPTATVNNSQWVEVTGFLGTCSDTEDIYLQIIAPEVTIDAAGPTSVCEGTPVPLTANNNVSDSGITWTPNFGLDDASSATPIANPSFTTTYTVTVETGGCTASDQITITVEPFDVPQLAFADTTLCQNSSVTLAAAIPNTSTTFEWTPIDGLDDPTVANPVATPDVPTTYTFTATSVNGICTETGSINVTVLPANVDIQGPDTLQICYPESGSLTALTSTGGLGLTWSPNDSLSSTTDETVFVNPLYSMWYYATLEIGECTVLDSVYIQVDSLPELSLEAIPMKDMYCEGEIVSLVSPTYFNQGFPDISHVWVPATGAVTEDTLFNLVINASETTVYQRFTENNACSAMNEIEIIVVPTAEITVTPDMPLVCAGEAVQLTASSPDISEFEWSPSAGLSCTDCPNPTANPPGTITYQVEGEFMGCPSTAQIQVEVAPAPIYDFPNPPRICQGESIILNDVVDPSATYIWTDENGNSISNAAQPEVSPQTTTTYTLEIENGLCPPITENITIVVIEPYELSVFNGDTSLCLGTEITLSADAGVPGTYFWDPIDVEAQSVNVNVDATTTYTLTFTDAEGCFPSEMVSFTITSVNPFILDSLEATPSTVFEGELITLTSITNPPALTNPTYVWELDNDEIDQTNEGTLIYEAPEVDETINIIFGVSVVDEFGCASFALDTVTVMNSFFDVPSAFSPGNDDVNERFNLLRSPNITVHDFRVYNRWGQKVYDNDDNEMGWDGTFNGKPAPADVYVYYIRFDFSGNEMVYKGDVTLLR